MFSDKMNKKGFIYRMISYNPLKILCNLLDGCRDGIFSPYKPSNNMCILFWEGIGSFIAWWNLLHIFYGLVMIISDQMLGYTVPYLFGSIGMTLGFVGIILSLCVLGIIILGSMTIIAFIIPLILSTPLVMIFYKDYVGFLFSRKDLVLRDWVKSLEIGAKISSLKKLVPKCKDIEFE